MAIGCPVAERAWILPKWIAAVKSQTVSTDIVCVYSHSHDGTLKLLEEAGAHIIESNFPTRDQARIYDHLWDQQRGEYRMMSILRNELVEWAQEGGYDFFFSLDSDIILPHEHALHDLMEDCIEVQPELASDAVAPLVDMILPIPNGPKTQCAYNFMGWDNEGFTFEHGDRSIKPEAPKHVAAIMAAMLLNRKAMEVRWHDHRQGEDIGWSLDAWHKGVKLMIDPRIECLHAMNHHMARYA